MKRGGKRSTGVLGVGIIGAGTMGRIHSECFRRIRGCRIVGVYNPTRSKAEKLAADSGGATVVDSVDDLLKLPGLDAVVIASPQTHHRDQAVAAARAGKHILCEKPLALTLDEMDQVAAAVRKAGVVFVVGHQMRLHPVVLAVKSAMPRLGRCYALDLEWAFRIAGVEGRCWMNHRQGGFFMELGCHAADLARFLMGPIRHVSANTLRLNPGRVTEDYTHALLQFDNFASGSLVVSANHRTTMQGMLRGRVLGEKGRIDFTCYPYSRKHNRAVMVLDKGKSVFIPDVTTADLRFASPKSLFKVYPGFYDVYQRQAELFVRAIRRGGAVHCTLEDGRSAVDVVLSIYDQQSRKTREPNFKAGKRKLRSDATSHPMLK